MSKDSYICALCHKETNPVATSSSISEPSTLRSANIGVRFVMLHLSEKSKRNDTGKCVKPENNASRALHFIWRDIHKYHYNYTGTDYIVFKACYKKNKISYNVSLSLNLKITVLCLFAVKEWLFTCWTITRHHRRAHHNDEKGFIYLRFMSQRNKSTRQHASAYPNRSPEGT